jgi:hypothetical protein
MYPRCKRGQVVEPFIQTPRPCLQRGRIYFCISNAATQKPYIFFECILNANPNVSALQTRTSGAPV